MRQSVELQYIELTEAHCHLESAEAGTREVTHILENKSAPGLAVTLRKKYRKITITKRGMNSQIIYIEL